MTESVGTGAEQRQQIALRHRRQRAVPAKAIRRFADRPDHVGGNEPAAALFDGNDFVVGIVESGPDQIVHGGVHDDEVFPSGLFDVFNAGDEDAGVAGDEAPRLDQDFQSQWRQQGNEAVGIGRPESEICRAKGCNHQSGAPLARAGS